MTLSDQPGPGGGIVLTSTSGASIAVSDAGMIHFEWKWRIDCAWWGRR